jgi:hypothetical protein
LWDTRRRKQEDDFVRTKTLVSRAMRLNSANITGLQDFNMLLPIPQTEIDLNNGATLTQNPGYQ